MAQANLIRRYRFHHGEMTQQRLADLSGVSRQTINALERNKVSPSLEVAFKIARAFGASIEDIFFYESDRKGEHPFKDGVVVEVTLGDPSGGSTDKESDGM